MLRILLVDGTLAFREALAQNLLQYLPEGCVLEQHSSTLNLRDKVLAAQPDVVILDANVPGSMEPKAWLERLLGPIAKPVVFYNSRIALRSAALAAGAVDFILKPPESRLSSAFFKKVANTLELAALKQGAALEGAEAKQNNPMYIPAKGDGGQGGNVRREASSVGQTLRSMRLAKAQNEDNQEELPQKDHGVVGRSGANRKDASADMKRLISDMKNFTDRLNRKAETTMVGGFTNAGRFRTATPAVKVEEYTGPVTMIAVGASTGGTEALSKVLSSLRPPLPGIVVVQHIPPSFSRMFAERLERECAVHVKEAATGDRVEQNNIYVAPGGKHMRVHKVGNDYMIECQPGPKLHGVCPAVDILFDSVAESVGGAALGVILTGMGRDGAAGMLHMRQQGSRTLGQDEASCVVYGMPRAAWECGAVARQVSLNEMAGAIMTELPGR